MNKGKRPIGKILMILSVVFFYLPILYMIIFSFNDGKSLTSFAGFSLRWYKHMLESADMMDALSTTFSIALLATFISTVAGTIAAIGVSKSKKLIRDLMEQAVQEPQVSAESHPAAQRFPDHEPGDRNCDRIHVIIHHIPCGKRIRYHASGTYCILYTVCYVIGNAEDQVT